MVELRGTTDKGRIEIWIPFLMPSANQFLHGGRQHPGRAPSLRHHQAYKRFLWQVMWAIRAAIDVPENRSKKRMKVTVLAHVKRRLDDDNFVGGLKPLYDALQRMNFIWTDHPRWVDKKQKQRLIWPAGSDEPWTEITIEPAGKEQPDGN